MGDMQIGLIAGATLELAWLGLVPNAGAQPPDVTMGTIAAVAFAVMTGQSAEVAMGVGMPIAVLMQMLVIGFFALTSFTMGKADRFAETGDSAGDRQTAYHHHIFTLFDVCACGFRNGLLW